MQAKEVGFCRRKALNQFQKENVKLHKCFAEEEAECIDFNQRANALSERIRSLEKNITTKEMCQLHLSQKLLNDNVKENRTIRSKICKQLSDITFEKHSLEDKVIFLLEENQKKEKEISKKKFQLKTGLGRQKYKKENYCCFENDFWYDYGETADSQGETESLQERVRLEQDRKREIQRKLDKSPKNEYFLTHENLRLIDDNEDKDCMINEIARQWDEYLRTKNYRDAEMENICSKLNTQIKFLETKLEQSNAELKVAKEQETTEMTKTTQMSLEIESLQVQVHDRNKQIEHFHEQSKQSRDELRVTNHELKKLHEENDMQSKHIEKLNETIKSLYHYIDKQNEQIHHLEEENENKDSEIESNEHLRKRNENLQEALYKSSELENVLRKTNNELQVTCRLLQMQMKAAEAKLQKFEQQEKQDKEMIRPNEKHLMKMSDKTESLETISKDKDTAMQECNEDLRDAIKSLNMTYSSQIKIKTNNGEDIDKLQKEIEYVGHDNGLLDKRMKQMQKALVDKHNSEAELAKTNQDLRCTIQERDDHISTLNVHVNEMSNLLMQTENKLKIRDISLQAELSNQMSDIKCLKEEIARKDIELSNLDEVKKQTELVQQTINKLKEKELTLHNTNQVLRSKIEEKENEIFRLKKHLNEVSKRCNEREIELRTLNGSIDQQLKNAQTKLRQQELEISHGKELLNTNRKRLSEMSEERDSLSRELKDKEIALQEVNEKFKNNVTRKEEADIKLNEMAHQHKTEIKRLQDEMEKRDFDKTKIDQLNAHNTHLQESFKESKKREAELHERNMALRSTMKEKDNIISTLTGKETALHKSNKILQKMNEETQSEVIELKQQLDEMSRNASQKEIDFGTKNILETQLKSGQVKLQQQELELSQGKELLKIKEKEILKLSKEKDNLDRTLQESIKLREEADSRLNEITDKLKKEIHQLQNELKERDMPIAKNDQLDKRSKREQQNIDELYTKESELRIINQALQSTNTEKNDKIDALKRQLDEMSVISNQKDNQLKKMIYSLRTQLQTTESKSVKLSEEIKSLKEEVKQKENKLQELNVNYKEDEKMKREKERNVCETINNQMGIMQQLQTEIEERDKEMSNFDHEKKRNDHDLQQELIQLKERESALRKTSQDLQNRIDEKDNEIVKLKLQLENMSKESNQKENKIQNNYLAIKRQLKTAEREMNQLRIEITNERELVSKNQKQEVEMGEEIICFKQELIQLKEKESALRKTCQDLQNRIDKKDNEIVKLKMQLENMSKESNHKENELQNKNLAIKRQLQTAERELKQLRMEITNERELVSKNLKQEVEMGEEIKCFKKELIQLNKRESSLRNTTEDLQNRIDEKDNEIVKLKLQLENMSKESNNKENELQNKNLAIKRQLQTAERDLKHLQKEITYERELVNKNQKQEVEMGEEIKWLKQELIQLKEKESSLRKTTEDLQNRIDEKDNEIVKLKLQLENMFKESNHKENELQNKNFAIKRQLQTAERELKQLRIEITNERELVSKNQKQEVEMGEEIKCFKKELIQLKEKESALCKTCQNLQNRIDERDNEIVKLKLQLENMSKESNLKENELQNKNLAIKRQLQTAESELKQLRMEITNERELVSKNQKQEVEMGEEIKCLKQKVKLTERQLEEFNDALEQNQDAELKLKRTIAKQNSDNQRFILEIERKNDELASLAEKNKHLKEIQKLYIASQEKESTSQKMLNEINKKNHENEKRITDLTQRLQKTIEKSRKMESELNDKNLSLQKNIKSLETDIEVYKQEISKEKRVGNSNQTKMSEMKARIDTLMNELKTKEDEQQKIKDNLNGIINSHEKQKQHLERNILQQEKKMRFVEVEKNNELKVLKNKNAENEKQLQQALSKLHEKESELDDTKSRLSRVMGDKLTDNNPNITDLSDKNRPTKIAEKCAELYDNEWTDAFDILGSRFKAEEAVIEVLLRILQDTMSFCMAMARRQIETIEREMNFADKDEMITISSEIQKLIKDRRKASASVVAGNLKKIYLSQLKQSGDKISRAALDVREYTSECIEICWFMLIQDPPVVFCPLPTKGSNFDTNFYKPYTKSGSHVEFAVWPSLLLHDGGPILAKGVAQGYVRK